MNCAKGSGITDSGTGKLDDISGTLEIDNEEVKHSYVLEYNHQWPCAIS